MIAPDAMKGIEVVEYIEDSQEGKTVKPSKLDNAEKAKSLTAEFSHGEVAID